MQIASLILGILSIVGMLVAFIPCLGSLNWLNIPFSVIGLIISVVANSSTTLPREMKGNSRIGIILCSIAILFGIMRLILGGGLL
ncbi:hypothetical protein D3C87_1309170 [compost metagenome]|jgi:hypothetical protein